MQKIGKYTIEQNSKIIEALAKINEFSAGQALVLFVLNEKSQIIGSLTDGDIRRALLAGINVDEKVTRAMNKDFHCIKNILDFQKIKTMKENDIKIIPQVTEDNKIIKIIDLKSIKTILPIDAVIMAGGKGVRLKPYTNDLPKPMLELNKKPIIVHNIDRLITYGVQNFYISVNHLKDQIKNYLNKYYKDEDVNIYYIEEEKPLGTVGSVGLIDGLKNDDILVMNADILTNIDFEDFYLNYKNFNDDMSVATFNVKIDIPYAVMETESKTIKSLIEKPTYTYYSNAGIYLLNKKFIKLIPQGEIYDTIDLIEDMIKNNKKVSHFPIRGYWIDIGTAQNYSKAQDDIRYVKF